MCVLSGTLLCLFQCHFQLLASSFVLIPFLLSEGDNKKTAAKHPFVVLRVLLYSFQEPRKYHQLSTPLLLRFWYLCMSKRRGKLPRKRNFLRVVISTINFSTTCPHVSNERRWWKDEDAASTIHSGGLLYPIISIPSNSGFFPKNFAIQNIFLHQDP